jgi:hypothetical protein
MKYTIKQSGFIIQIVRIKYVGKTYKKCAINWIDKATGKVVFSERNVKIPNECFEFWTKVE